MSGIGKMSDGARTRALRLLPGEPRRGRWGAIGEGHAEVDAVEDLWQNGSQRRAQLWDQVIRRSGRMRSFRSGQ